MKLKLSGKVLRQYILLDAESANGIFVQLTALMEHHPEYKVFFLTNESYRNEFRRILEMEDALNTPIMKDMEWEIDI